MYTEFKWTTTSYHRIQILAEYEPIQPFFLLELARASKCNCFLDIGANVGVYSLLMSGLPDVGKVVAFEPAPDTVDELRRNLTLNGRAGSIEVIEKGLSNAEGEVSFGIVGKLSGANSIVHTSIHEAEKFSGEIRIQIVPLDFIFLDKKFNRICMKVDVEGHELEVLEGAEVLLRTRHALIQLERYEDDRKIADFLSAVGYRQVSRIGPDCYFTNIPEVDETMLLKAFEKASGVLIDYNHNPIDRIELKAETASLRLPAGVSVHLTGGLARRAKQLRSQARRLIGKT